MFILTMVIVYLVSLLLYALLNQYTNPPVDVYVSSKAALGRATGVSRAVM